MIYEPLSDDLDKKIEQRVEDVTVEETAAHFSDESREERMQAAMLAIMDGSVTRGRSLKYWENLRLKPRHMQMLLMKAAGYTNNQIADRMEMTPSRVSIIVNHPDAAYLLSHLVSFQAENLLDIKARIQAHAGEALDTALFLMRTSKPEVRERVAFRLLDRAGYGAVQRSEVSHKVEMPAAQAANLIAAMQESAEVEVTDYEILENVGQAGEGGTSDSTASEPPTSHQLVSTRRTA